MFAANQAAAQTVTNASDNAGNYSSGWTNGANGGTGFGAWTLVSSNGTLTSSYGGSFVGNPASAGIAGMSTNSFGLYANPNSSGSFANAERILTYPLGVGQTLRLQWGINYDSGSNGNKGFNLIAGGTEIINVNNGPSANITLNGTNVGFGYGTTVMTWSFTRTAANTITVVANDRDGSGTYSNNIPVANGAVSSFKFYAAQMQSGDAAQPYFNNLEVFGPTPATNQVTFTVNMSYQASQGFFSTNSDTVQVRGDFNNWTGNLLTNQGNNIFGGTFPISATEGTPLNYKFWNSATNAPNSGFESGANRVFTMGANGTTNTLPVVYFSNLAGERFVTFSVNMAIQQGKGAFNPATNSVEVRGPFNGWNGNLLTNVPGGSIYSGTFLLSSSNTNTSIPYKFYAAGTNAAGWEVIPGAENRTFDLVFNTNASNAPALVLTTNFFSNELFYVTGTPLNGFGTTQGTASAPQSLTVNGQGLTADVSVVAPTGFEVSTNGASYFGSLSIAPISNTISAATLYTRIAASAAVGSPAGNVDLTSTGSQQVNVAVNGTVTAANPYDSWASGYGLAASETSGPTAGAPAADPDNDGFNNQSEYAFGTNPTQGNAALLSVSTSDGNMIVTWLQRTDAAPGAYKVKTTTSLSTPFTVDATLTAAIIDGSATPTPPAGYARKKVSVATSSGRNFLALAFD